MTLSCSARRTRQVGGGRVVTLTPPAGSVPGTALGFNLPCGDQPPAVTLASTTVAIGSATVAITTDPTPTEMAADRTAGREGHRMRQQACDSTHHTHHSRLPSPHGPRAAIVLSQSHDS